MRPRAPRKLRKPMSDGELRAVVDETIALFHRLRWVAEQIYGEEGRSTARRGILRGLLRYGPQTVPQMARARRVTRQHVQGVVDALVRDGTVTLEPNPKHARSHLVRIMRKGEQLVLHMDETDERVLAALDLRIPESQIAAAVRTLRRVREAFEHGTKWRRALQD